MARKHLITGIALGLFALVFAGFLIAAAYFYFTDGENMTIKSFAPGAPALFLGFLSRNQFRSYRAARKLEQWKARQAAEANVST
ncbi:hypothetical protein [Lewinella sp. 4G2]|uniref:hypothetical protein n=1 Tax=Lewinella sp. 4G2 TaxID=1803372 RepID=UPI0007B47566|nr:hypothetical protein [Lewinella sp. 4G2]OAV45573.1 hypothetical protein A3850_014205 [Lewinella sp. 4G2]